MQTVGVVGAGQMGSGIAQVAAQAGLTVVLVDRSEDDAVRGQQRIKKHLDRQVQKGRLDSSDAQAIAGRVRASGTLEALSGADYVVEAAPEAHELKRSVFVELDGITPAHAVLATNTSSISITALAAATKRPGKVIGMHFMNPVPAMKLVEIIRGLQTSDETYAVTRALAERLGKDTVLAKEAPGFIVNRILIPMLNEAIFVLENGLASEQDIDAAMKLGTNQPMGPLALADLIGLDTVLAICECLHKELGDDKYRPAPLLRRYVAAGWLGRKAERGFYTYG
ncbi:MAG: 3-hydroxybutyryl-CoA dehydrogenase [Myxococcales bacterium]|nr:3-hydroxybutyryl-CoA dehydrogenase [Myxococcales bacterium]MDD9965613.1 3-hydroxybutyryl-CoA dehydrogenase [Myxococcales bacterium]